MRGSLDQLWWPVPGWEGFYEVSNRGRVRSLDRWVEGQRRRFWPGVELTPRMGSGGYLSVTLHRAGDQWQVMVHRLVMLTFAGACPDGNEVAHENGIRTDNRLSNLRYTTRADSHNDKRAHGTHLEGERTPAAKLTAQQARTIYQFRGAGRQVALSLAAEHGCCEDNIYAIWSGKSLGSVNQ